MSTKNELLQKANSLGLSVNASMSGAELTALIAGSERPVADATAKAKSKLHPSGEKGRSVIVGFHYMGKYCKAQLKNGVSGIVGTAEQYPFGTMLMLKGTGQVVNYERLTDNDEYKRYSLSWSLE